MAAANSALLDKLQRQGYRAVQPASGLLALQSVLCQGHNADLSVVMVSPFLWGTFLTGTICTACTPGDLPFCAWRFTITSLPAATTYALGTPKTHTHLKCQQ